MPRMNLTEREAQIIHKEREQTRFYKAGAEYMLEQLRQRMANSTMTYNEIIAELERIANEL